MYNTRSGAFGDRARSARFSSRKRRSTWPTSKRSCCAWTPSARTPDDLNAIFRAVHSIKGSAAMLGCNDMAALTHLQENLLDLLRKDERPLRARAMWMPCSRPATSCARRSLHHRGVLVQPPDSPWPRRCCANGSRRPRTDARRRPRAR